MMPYPFHVFTGLNRFMQADRTAHPPITTTRQVLPKALHFILVDGSASAANLTTLNAWCTLNPDYRVTLWHDPAMALLATIGQSLEKRIAAQGKRDDTLGAFTDHRLDCYDDVLQRLHAEVRDAVKDGRSPESAIFSFGQAEQLGDLEGARQTAQARLAAWAADHSALQVKSIDAILTSTAAHYYHFLLARRLDARAAAHVATLSVLSAQGGVVCRADALPRLADDIVQALRAGPGRHAQAVVAATEYALSYLGLSDAAMPNFDMAPVYDPVLIRSLIENRPVGEVFPALGEIELPLQGIALSARTESDALDLTFIASHPLPATADDHVLSHLHAELAMRAALVLPTADQSRAERRTYAAAVGEKLNHATHLPPSPIARQELIRAIIATEGLVFGPPDCMPDLLAGSPAITDGLRRLTGTPDSAPAVRQALADLRTVSQADGEVRLDLRLATATFHAAAASDADNVERQTLLAHYRQAQLERSGEARTPPLDFHQWRRPGNASPRSWTVAPPDENGPFQHHFVIQLQGDEVSFEAAAHRFGQQPDKSTWIQMREDGQQGYRWNRARQTMIPISTDSLYVLHEPGPVAIDFVGTDTDTGIGGRSAEQFAELAVRVVAGINPQQGADIFLVGQPDAEPGAWATSPSVNELLNGLAGMSADTPVWSDRLRIHLLPLPDRKLPNGATEVLTAEQGLWERQERLRFTRLEAERLYAWDAQSRHYALTPPTLDGLQRMADALSDAIAHDYLPVQLRRDLSDLQHELLGRAGRLVQALPDSPHAQREVIEAMTERALNVVDLAHRWTLEINTLREAAGMNADWTPQLHTTVHENGRWTIRFYDQATGATRAVEGAEILGGFKDTIDALSTTYRTRLGAMPGMAADPTAHSEAFQDATLMGVALLLHSLPDLVTQLSSKSVSDSVRIQLYLDLTQSGIGAAVNFGTLINLFAEGMEWPTQLFPFAFEVAQGATALVDVARIVFKIMNIASETDPYERSKLAFDLSMTLLSAGINVATLGLALSASRVAVSAATAAALGSAAGLLSIITVPLTGLTLALPSLVNNYINLARMNDEFLAHSLRLAELARGAMFEPDSRPEAARTSGSPVLRLTDGIPLAAIDFEKGEARLGQVMFLPLHGGSGFSIVGHTPSFFSAPTCDMNGAPLPFFPVVAAQGGQTLEVMARKPFDRNSTVLVLPAQPDLTLSYDFQQKPGVRYKTGQAVDLMDAMAAAYPRLFYWYYYAIPTDFAIIRTTSHSRTTALDIMLDDQDRVLVAPDVRDERAGFIEYVFHPGGKTTQIVMSGSAMRLKLAAGPDSRWELDATATLYQRAYQGAIRLTEVPVPNALAGLFNTPGELDFGTTQVSIDNSQSTVVFMTRLPNIAAQLDYIVTLATRRLEATVRLDGLPVHGALNKIRDTLHVWQGSSSMPDAYPATASLPGASAVGMVWLAHEHYALSQPNPDDAGSTLVHYYDGHARQTVHGPGRCVANVIASGIVIEGTIQQDGWTISYLLARRAEQIDIMRVRLAHADPDDAIAARLSALQEQDVRAFLGVMVEMFNVRISELFAPAAQFSVIVEWKSKGLIFGYTADQSGMFRMSSYSDEPNGVVITEAQSDRSTLEMAPFSLATTTMSAVCPPAMAARASYVVIMVPASVKRIELDVGEPASRLAATLVASTPEAALSVIMPGDETDYRWAAHQQDLLLVPAQRGARRVRLSRAVAVAVPAEATSHNALYSVHFGQSEGLDVARIRRALTEQPPISFETTAVTVPWAAAISPLAVSALPVDVTLTWSVDDSDWCDIDTRTGEMRAQRTGLLRVYARTHQDVAFAPQEISYLMTVQPQSLAMRFDPESITVARNLIPDHPPLLGLPENETVTWTSSQPAVATVDEQSGQVQPITVGSTRITATLAASPVRVETRASYTLDVAADRTDPGFNHAVLRQTWGTSVRHHLMNRHEDDVVAWRSTNLDIATVDEGSGRVTMLKAGQTTIIASISSRARARQIEASYVLVIDRKPVTLAFAAINGWATWGTPYLPDRLSINTAPEAVEWESSRPDIIRISPDGSEAELLRAGRSTLIARFRETDTHAAAQAQYTVVVRRAAQTLTFSESAVERSWTSEGVDMTALLSEGYPGRVSWQVSVGEETHARIAHIDEHGRLWLEGSGSLTVTASLAETLTHAAAQATCHVSILPVAPLDAVLFTLESVLDGRRDLAGCTNPPVIWRPAFRDEPLVLTISSGMEAFKASHMTVVHTVVRAPLGVNGTETIEYQTADTAVLTSASFQEIGHHRVEVFLTNRFDLTTRAVIEIEVKRASPLDVLRLPEFGKLLRLRLHQIAGGRATLFRRRRTCDVEFELAGVGAVADRLIEPINVEVFKDASSIRYLPVAVESTKSFYVAHEDCWVNHSGTNHIMCRLAWERSAGAVDRPLGEYYWEGLNRTKHADFSLT